MCSLFSASSCKIAGDSVDSNFSHLLAVKGAVFAVLYDEYTAIFVCVCVCVFLFLSAYVCVGAAYGLWCEYFFNAYRFALSCG